MSYFLRKSVRKRGLYLQIYESHYSKERKKTVTRFVMTIGYHEDLKKIHRDPVDHGLSLVRAMNCDVPRKIRGKQDGRTSTMPALSTSSGRWNFCARQWTARRPFPSSRNVFP